MNKKIISQSITFYLVAILLCTSACKESYNYKYECRISNWHTTQYLKCDSYTREGNNYKLYKGNTLIKELVVTDGYMVSFTLLDN